MSPPLILALGRRGQLACALLEQGAPAGFVLRAMGRDEIDLARPGAAAAAIAALKPAAIINAAAATDVAASEVRDRDLATALNAHAPAEIAEACARIGASFVHVSTDYVFDGEGAPPYAETAPPNPINHYGATKLAGERAALAVDAPVAVLRTAWVFSHHGANFIKAMLNAGAGEAPVRAAQDQFNRPTPCDALARACLAMAVRLREDPSARGLWHYAGREDASRADWVEAAFAAASRRGARLAPVVRVDAAEFESLVRRPRDTRLDSAAIARLLGEPTPSWREGLERLAARLYS